jgi:hypothetical protein
LVRAGSESFSGFRQVGNRGGADVIGIMPRDSALNGIVR